MLDTKKALEVFAAHCHLKPNDTSYQPATLRANQHYDNGRPLQMFSIVDRNRNGIGCVYVNTRGYTVVIVSQ